VRALGTFECICNQLITNNLKKECVRGNVAAALLGGFQYQPKNYAPNRGSSRKMEKSYGRITRSRQRRNLRKVSLWTTNQNVRSVARGSMRAKAKLSRQPHTRSQPPMHPRSFVLIYALGVRLGISRKTQAEAGRIVDKSTRYFLYSDSLSAPVLLWNG
jgi:hypothetical protein